MLHYLTKVLTNEVELNDDNEAFLRVVIIIRALGDALLNTWVPYFLSNAFFTSSDGNLASLPAIYLSAVLL
jgi:hypothetical protein